MEKINLYELQLASLLTNAINGKKCEQENCPGTPFGYEDYCTEHLKDLQVSMNQWEEWKHGL